MKKMLVSTITAALVVGAASTTFAAANPFSDVPADHWAYDAVTQLVEDGVIEGYGDMTFKGDKNITRYEMAQMTAKAMAKNNAGGADKALVDKLAAEFADELNNLGVRVSNLERNADMVKWGGEVRYTYTSARTEKADGSTKKNNQDEFLLRLEPTAEVNSHWHVKARLDAANNMKSDTSDNVKLKRVWAQGDYKNFKVKLGKFPDITAYDKSMMLNTQMSGAEVIFGNKLTATVRAGRLNLKDNSIFDNRLTNESTLKDSAANMQSLALSYTADKLSGTAVYYHFDSNAFMNTDGTINKAGTASGTTAFDYSKDGRADSANIWEIAGAYRFDKNVALAGAFAKNTKADYYDAAHMVQLDYKGAKAANKGSWGAYLAYRYLGGNVALDACTDGVGYNQKGWEIGTQYTLLKNVQAKAIYFNGKQLTNNKDASKLFGRVEFFF